MAQLETIKVTDSKKIEKANSGSSIIASNTWPDKGTFKITGFEWVELTIDGVTKDRLYPTFTTTLGINLHVSTLLKPKPTASGEVLTPNGSLNQLVKKLLSEAKTNGEFLQAVVNKTKDKEITIHRIPYIGIAKDNVRFATALLEFDIAE